MTPLHSEPSLSIKLSFFVLILVSAAMAIFAAVLMTEPGQLLDLNRDWVVTYYRYRWPYGGVVLLFFSVAFFLGLKYKIIRAVYIIIIGLGIVAALYVANALIANSFPTKHKTAVYLPISQADLLLGDEEIVYAVEINGEAVAYPRRFMVIPHVAGKNIGGIDVALTFCALSNLPMVYDTRLGGQETDLRILIQTHNNLVLFDENSGDVIQQITGEAEFSGLQMHAYANQMMSWEAFKSLYPQGEVFEYKFDRWLDKKMSKAFSEGIKKQFDPTLGPMFPTLRLDDDRLPLKEQVWGLNINGEQLAIARSYFGENHVIHLTVGGEPIVLSYSAEYDTLGIFYRDLDTRHAEVDVYGNSSAGKLSRVPSYNGVFWMVWSHFFPNTQVMK